MCQRAPIRSAAIDSSVFGRAAFCCQAMKWWIVSSPRLGLSVMSLLRCLFVGGARSKELGGAGGHPDVRGKNERKRKG